MNRIWYKLNNTKDYDHLPGLLWVQPHTFCSLQNTIQSSIDSFNNSIVWTEMWDMEDAESRLKEGHDLFLGVDEQGPISHVWFEKNYLYNLYTNTRRLEGYTEKFIKGCLNFLEYDTIELYCDEWNIRAQKLFEKVGFTKK